MPKELEAKLKRRAKKMGLGKERAGAYVYGTLRKTGWKPSREKGPAKAGKKRGSSNVVDYSSGHPMPKGHQAMRY